MNENELNQMLSQVQKMQTDMLAAQDALAGETVEASAGGGAVKAVVTGDLERKSASIDPGVVDPGDVEMLEDLVVAAVGEATRMARRLRGVAGGLDLGRGLPGLLAD